MFKSPTCVSLVLENERPAYRSVPNFFEPAQLLRSVRSMAVVHFFVFVQYVHVVFLSATSTRMLRDFGLHTVVFGTRIRRERARGGGRGLYSISWRFFHGVRDYSPELSTGYELENEDKHIISENSEDFGG